MRLGKALNRHAGGGGENEQLCPDPPPPPLVPGPSTLVSVAVTVLPVASVMMNVRSSKQLPLVVIVNAPPLLGTMIGRLGSVTKLGRLATTRYGGSPPNT